jgi:tellurite methyltransferase
MSDEERDRWNRRYVREGAWRPEPAAFLVEVSPQLPPGSRILDAGGGTGRNAVWLARQGHQVTIADISETGLEFAKQGAADAAVEVDTVCMDFDTDPMPAGPWDVILDFHFIKRYLFPVFYEVLRPGGLLVFCRATVKNLERHERPPRAYVIEEGEGWRLLEGWELLIAREGWSIEDRHEFEALARRPERLPRSRDSRKT